MSIPENLKYTSDHEWVRLEDDGMAYVGITDYAQSELGELVYIEVDTVGEELEAGEVFGVAEAVKTTSDLFMPITGTVEEFNKELDESEGDNPKMIHDDPYGEGWIIKIKIKDMSELDDLLDHAGYSKEIGA